MSLKANRDDEFDGVGSGPKFFCPTESAGACSWVVASISACRSFSPSASFVIYGWKLEGGLAVWFSSELTETWLHVLVCHLLLLGHVLGLEYAL